MASIPQIEFAANHDQCSPQGAELANGRITRPVVLFEARQRKRGSIIGIDLQQQESFVVAEADVNRG